MFTRHDILPNGLAYSMRGVAFLVFILMAWSDRASDHWAGFTVVSLAQFLWILGITCNPVAA
jgi:hypothetical protein